MHLLARRQNVDRYTKRLLENMDSIPVNLSGTDTSHSCKELHRQSTKFVHREKRSGEGSGHALNGEDHGLGRLSQRQK